MKGRAYREITAIEELMGETSPQQAKYLRPLDPWLALRDSLLNLSVVDAC